jgi:hypothetical protein
VLFEETRRHRAPGSHNATGKWLVHCHIPHHTANNNVEQMGGGGLMLVLNVQ